jgi:hypothetical protein
VSAAKRRRKARERATRAASNVYHVCPNCREVTNHGHFAVPGMGQDGFFICPGWRHPVNPIEDLLRVAAAAPLDHKLLMGEPA